MIDLNYTIAYFIYAGEFSKQKEMMEVCGTT